MPTILIVRPQGQTAADIDICTAAGWQALPFSPLRLEADTAALRQLPALFAAADVVFWVSPGAVNVAAPGLDFSGSAAQQVTVGQASAQALAAYCTQPISAPGSGNDSEAVLRLALWQSLPRGANVLIIRGHGGRDFLAQALRQQGFKVTVAEVYFRQPQALDWGLFVHSRPQALYVASAALAQALFVQAPPELAQNLKNLLYFTHHQRIADALRDYGVNRIQTGTLAQLLPACRKGESPHD